MNRSCTTLIPRFQKHLSAISSLNKTTTQNKEQGSYQFAIKFTLLSNSCLVRSVLLSYLSSSEIFPEFHFLLTGRTYTAEVAKRWATWQAISWLLVATHVLNGATSSCLPRKRQNRWATSCTSGGLAIGHVFGSPSKATDTCVQCMTGLFSDITDHSLTPSSPRLVMKPELRVTVHR